MFLLQIYFSLYHVLMLIILAASYALKLETSGMWNLHGRPGNGYYIRVKIGDPWQMFNILVDTGSSNLAIAGMPFPEDKSYFNSSQSNTFMKNGTKVQVSYTQGSWEGFIGQDLVCIPSLDEFNPIVTHLSIITNANGFYVNNSHWQGILGLAYPEIAKPYGYVVPWFDSIVQIFPHKSEKKFELELCGPSHSNRSIHYGRFSVGSTTHSCQKSEYSAPVHHRWYYEVSITQMVVGEKKVGVSCMEYNNPKTIIDSGTSNLQLSSVSYHTVILELKMQSKTAFPNSFWYDNEEVCFPQSSFPWKLLPTLTIYLSQTNTSDFGLVLSPSSYIRPALNASKADTCWKLGIEKARIGTVLGTVVLEGLCVTFNRNENAIYFAESILCNSSVKVIPGTGRKEAFLCQHSSHMNNTTIIVTTIIFVVILLPMLFALVRYIYKDFVRPKLQETVSFITLNEQNT